MKKKLKLVVGKRAGKTEKAARPGTESTGAKVKKTGSTKTSAAAGRYVGKTTGLSVSKYQNKTILENTKNKFSDEKLADMWNREFPNVKTGYTAQTVRGVRNLINRPRKDDPTKGMHGNDLPKNRVPEYNEQGEPLPFWGSKAEERERERELRQTAKAVKAQKSAKTKVKAKIKKSKKTA